MQKEQQELANLIKGKKVAFIGAGCLLVSW